MFGINLLSQCCFDTDVKHRSNANHSYNEDCLWFAGHWECVDGGSSRRQAIASIPIISTINGITTSSDLKSTKRVSHSSNSPLSKRSTINMNIKFTDRTPFPNIGSKTVQYIEKLWGRNQNIAIVIAQSSAFRIQAPENLRTQNHSMCL